ncbi:MAG: DUF1667 domain-containing protein [Oscillibacter sp.]|jgi:CxxC motif-containing protein|nr:DUF1667 domain-containing protein [Oscillibacter sp.]
MKQNLVCFLCPNSCELTVEETESGLAVRGNRCPRGEAFAKQELLDPQRTLTSSVRIHGAEFPLLSVRSDRPVKKRELLPLMQQLRSVECTAPIKQGDIILSGVGETAVNIIATRTMAAKVRGR